MFYDETETRKVYLPWMETHQHMKRKELHLACYDWWLNSERWRPEVYVGTVNYAEYADRLWVASKVFQ
jgi:hypothetical protein